MKKNYILWLLIALCYSCGPATKDDYLSEYQDFLIKVKDNWESYTEQDWQEVTAKFEDYSKLYYKRFRGELTTSEVVRVYRFDFAFHFYKGDISIKKILSGEYNDILKEYIEAFWEELKLVKVEIMKGLSDIRTEGLKKIINKLIE